MADRGKLAIRNFSPQQVRISTHISKSGASNYMDPKILSIFQEVFNNPGLEITDETTAADVEEWDSFNHLSLIMAIEDEFSVSFTTKEIGQAACVGDLVQVLQTKL